MRVGIEPIETYITQASSPEGVRVAYAAQSLAKSAFNLIFLALSRADGGFLGGHRKNKNLSTSRTVSAYGLNAELKNGPGLNAVFNFI